MVTCLYNFLNQNASSIRTILVARCPETAAAEEQKEAVSLIHRRESEKNNRLWKATDDDVSSSDESDVTSDSESEECDAWFGETQRPLTDDLEADCSVKFGCGTEERGSPSCSGSLPNNNQPVASARTERKAKLNDDHVQSLDYDLKQPKRYRVNSSLVSHDTMSQSCSFQCSKAVDDDFCDKYLIFTMGEKTYTPHQIGIKRIMAGKAKEIIDRLKQHEVRQTDVANGWEDPLQHVENDRFDSVDHMIELHGHIIGMCLSPDHR